MNMLKVNSTNLLSLPLPWLPKNYRLIALGFVCIGIFGFSSHPYLCSISILVASIFFGIYGAILSMGMVYLLPDAIATIPTIHGVIDAEIMTLSLLIAIPLHIQGLYHRKLHHQIMHDPGTGLPGRLALFKALSQNSLQDIGHGDKGLIVISIDNLPDIAVTFGYEAADVLTKILWSRIADAFEPDVKVYHYHRKRLAIIFDLSDYEIENLVIDIEKRFKESIEFEDIPLHFVAYIGLAVLNSNNFRQAINQAEAAAEYAKEHRIQSSHYNTRMARDRMQSLMLLGDMLAAMKTGDLSLHYQPKVDIQNLSIAGYEGLARWHHPKLGHVPPDRFIPLIEQTELIQPFTIWAIDQALSTLGRWRRTKNVSSIAVNISSYNLSCTEFPAQVRAMLDKHGLNSNCLELEVTESEIMRDPEQAIEVLSQLNDIPIVISIDDFGTGYSSLAYLHKLPATTIKLDMFFTQNIADSGVYAIVSSAIDLTHKLGMRIVAEGVETEAQLNLLKNLGCDLCQGYYFSKPLPEKFVEQWVTEFTAKM